MEISTGLCNARCATCTGPLENQCLSCKGLLTQLSTATNRCLVCEDGFYDSGTVCLHCPRKCRTCRNSQQCIDCNELVADIIREGVEASDDVNIGEVCEIRVQNF